MGERFTDEIIQMLTDDSVTKTAFNANFERICLSRYLDTFLQPVAWSCTAVQASMHALPLSLAGVGEVLNLDKKKMEEGKELIKYFCCPCKPTKINGGRTRNLPQDASDKWVLFKVYCIRDVEVEKQIRKRLSHYPIPEREQKFYCLDQKINDRGILINRNLLEKAITCDLLYKEMSF